MNLLVKPSIQELRELIGGVGSFNKKRRSCSFYEEGFSVGSIVEITGPGKTELVCQFLKENSEIKAAWIENEITVNPYGLFQKGVKLENILFIESKEEEFWCLTQALQSGCFEAVISCGVFEEKELRRFQLLAESSSSHFFLLSEDLHNSWVPQLQLKVSKKKKGVNVQVARKRGVG